MSGPRPPCPAGQDTLAAQLKAAVGLLAEVSESAALDAEVLLCHVLDKPRSYLRAWPEQCLTANQRSAFQTLLRQRHAGTPIAHLTGRREFWSREFLITPDVLIPRPATESLVEHALVLLAPDHACAIADLGTGSGIIAITLAAERPLAQVVACDLSPAALAVARANAERYRLGNLYFYLSDWFADIPSQRFDLIASNPPYIAGNDPHLSQGDVRFEPKTALVAAEQGLSAITTIAEQARAWLNPDGYLLIEHGYQQEVPVQAVFRGLGYANVQTHRDLSGQPRLTVGQYR